MTAKRPPYQLELDLPMPGRGEAPRRDAQEVEVIMGGGRIESPASTEHLMEAICAPDNIGAAVSAVRNKGAPGIDGIMDCHREIGTIYRSGSACRRARNCGLSRLRRRSSRSRDSWAYLRASSFKSKLRPHGSASPGSVVAGTQHCADAVRTATPDVPWDNPLVSTRVHNTITVDGYDHMTVVRRFLTLDWFPAFSKRLLGADAPAVGRMLASHNGYRRLGVRHQRLASVTEDGRWKSATI